MNVLVVDDHTAIRIGLKQILTDHAVADEVHEAGTGKQALVQIEAGAFDAVVLDIDLPDMSGLDVLAEIKRLQPKLPVLILSMLPEEHYAIRALKAGASGFLSKECAEDELAQAVRVVAEGQSYVSEQTVQQMARYISQDDEKPRHERLSNREFQIMRLIAKGKATSEIAQELEIHVKTVFTYRSRIFDKMDFSSNAEVIHYAVRHRLI